MCDHCKHSLHAPLLTKQLSYYQLYLFFTVILSSAKVQFNWRDALELDGLLTEEEVMIRDSFRTYCQEKLMPRVLMANRNEGKHY